MTDHQEREDIIGGTCRMDGLFVLNEQIKMFTCPCPSLVGLFLKGKGNKIDFVIRPLP